MSDSSLSAAARALNSKAPFDVFIAGLDYTTLHDLCEAMKLEVTRRIAENMATMNTHPPTPGCATCGAVPRAYHETGCADSITQLEFITHGGLKLVPGGYVMSRLVGDAQAQMPVHGLGDWIPVDLMPLDVSRIDSDDEAF